MGTTPDRFPGEREEDVGIILKEQGDQPIVEGEIRNVNGVLRGRDDSGNFNLRDGEPVPKGTSFPGSPANGDLFYRNDLNLLFHYDGSRSKWLSVTTFGMSGYRNLVAGVGLVYLDGFSATNGVKMPHAGTLISFSVKNNTAVTRDVKIYKWDGVATTLLGTLSLVAESEKYTDSADADFGEGDSLTIAVDFTAGSGALNDAFVLAEVAWRVA